MNILTNVKFYRSV